jgi:hypothetical protein
VTGQYSCGLEQRSIHLKHSLGGVLGILVLPNTKYSPPKIAQSLVGILIPLHILPNFPSPPIHVGLGSSAVNRTVVPEAAIDENCEARPRKCDVDGAIGTRDQSSLDAKAKTQTVQLRTKLPIRAIVGPSGRCHSTAGLG